jgi:hypothetical protein
MGCQWARPLCPNDFRGRKAVLARRSVGEPVLEGTLSKPPEKWGFGAA